MYRKIRKLNRITIPKKLRTKFGINPEILVEISIEYGNLFLKPFNNENLSDKPFVGVPRKIDSLGRVIVPKEYIDLLGVEIGEKYDLVEENGKIKIILQKI